MKINQKSLRELIKAYLIQEKHSLDESDPEKIAAKIKSRFPVLPPDVKRRADPGEPAETSPLWGSVEAKKSWADYEERDKDELRVAVEDEIKRIWAEEVDETPGARVFFQDEVVKVHWVGGYSTFEGKSYPSLQPLLGLLRSAAGSRNQNEFACLGFLQGERLEATSGGSLERSVGIVLDGYVSYASITDVMSQHYSTASEKVKQKYSTTGLKRRPFYDTVENISNEMMTDYDSFLKRNKSFHEVFVDNWTPIKVVIPNEFWKSYQRVHIHAFKEQNVNMRYDDAQEEKVIDELLDICNSNGIDLINENQKKITIDNFFEKIPNFWDVAEAGDQITYNQDRPFISNQIVGLNLESPGGSRLIKGWLFNGGKFDFDETKILHFEHCEFINGVFHNTNLNSKVIPLYLENCSLRASMFIGVNNRFIAKNCNFSDIKLKEGYSAINPTKYLKFINCSFRNCDSFFKDLSYVLKLKTDDPLFSIYRIDEISFESCDGVPSYIIKLLEEREQT